YIIDILTENSSITEALKTGNASEEGAFKKTVLTSFRKNIPLFLGDVACGNYTDILTYMNDEGLRKALNISSNLPKWDFCSGEVMKNYRKQYHDMAPFIKKIIRADVRVLLYYGDTDMACNFMMGQQFSHQLGLRQIRHSRPWKYDGQVGGYKTEYEGLTFITVRGAGHMAPQLRAPQTSYAIKQFLLNRPI
ncbi:serine carboxypeptidase, partial [Oesophagostomum dentatum]